MGGGGSRFSRFLVTPSLEGLFEILNIANRYQVTGLVKLAEQALTNLPVTADNIIFTYGES